MAVHPGRHQLGPENGRITVRTSRDGLAAQAGHDLTIEAPRWSAVLTVNDDGAPGGLEARIDVGALIVREGTGGVKPLTDRDRREIAVTSRKVLGADRHPEAVFTAEKFAPADGGGEITGTLSLRGARRPLRLQVTEAGPGRYRAETTVVQSDFGIKPYSAFLGALRVRDAIDVSIDVSLPESAAQEPADTAGDQR